MNEKKKITINDTYFLFEGSKNVFLRYLFEYFMIRKIIRFFIRVMCFINSNGYLNA